MGNQLFFELLGDEDKLLAFLEYLVDQGKLSPEEIEGIVAKCSSD